MVSVYLAGSDAHAPEEHAHGERAGDHQLHLSSNKTIPQREDTQSGKGFVHTELSSQSIHHRFVYLCNFIISLQFQQKAMCTFISAYLFFCRPTQP